MLKIIFCQPSTIYYSWQVESLLNNLKNLRFDLNNVHVVNTGTRTREFEILEKEYPAKFFYYPLTVQSSYIPINRPNSLKHHFAAYPELADERILYVDCDILFFNLNWLNELTESVTYLSDTKWYLGYSYFNNKANQAGITVETLLEPILTKVGVDLNTVKENDNNSGGAQYLFSEGVYTFDFWNDVEKDCTQIYEYFSYSFPDSVNRKYFKDENDGIQSWTADMWAVFWNLLKRKHPVKVVKEMNFAWPGYNITDADRFNILHNSGVIKPGKEFYKGMYLNKIPYKEDFSMVDRNLLSWKYVQNLIELKDKSKLIA